MPLDPAVAEMLAAAPAEAPPADAPPLTAADLRRMFQDALPPTGPLEPIHSVTDLTVPVPSGETRVRLYLPDAAGPVPVFVWIHGGGWTIGTVEENEVACHAVCHDAGVAVASIEYPLAPENPFPAALSDCYAVVEWLSREGTTFTPVDGGPAVDGSRIAVGGESAGGNLTAAICLKSRDESGPKISAQVMICPVLAHPQDGHASYTDFATGYGMTADSMHFFFAQYVPDPGALDDPYLLPSRAADLAGLPPALVMTAEYDVLRDEGEEYARRLQSAHVPTRLERYHGQIHGFYGLYTHLPASRPSQTDVADFLTDVI
ncbi:alpha/beta hydrolase [Speluncibacter jeojiensis]|uniref:Alpha/beta hydrolase n=1 Tax=Speluncibacter jeojiensis TaxID=2710754 RepID=A0A9X4RJB4_9ACTN|nr:alpha/beta hydrolase [Corynebacteriales bacterium D3-21]